MKNAFLLLTGAILVGCGGGYGGTTAPIIDDGRTVRASPSLTFGPASLTVNAGEAVTFAFGSVGHNVFFDAQAGAPANIEGTEANVSVTRSFNSSGNFHYTCHIHPGMQGTIIVR